MNNISTDRMHTLHHWLQSVLQDRQYDISPVSGDASFRRYFRVVTGNKSYIVMDAPPEKEDCQPFHDIANTLRTAGINVPQIHEAELDHGFLLLDDLGDTLYLNQLSDSTADKLYGDALDALFNIQATDAAGLSGYDDELLRFELELFREWFLIQHLGLSLSREQHHILDTVFEALIANALQQPRVFVHRDYHSRNLMLTEIGNPGVLDFQDAVYGPVTYDIVSLLRDCYISWPEEKVKAWALGYAMRLIEAGIIQPVDDKTFLHWFDLMGIQRHLKATGIFSRLHHRDGKSTYLEDIPRTLAYVLNISSQYPETQPLHALLKD